MQLIKRGSCSARRLPCANFPRLGGEGTAGAFGLYLCGQQTENRVKRPLMLHPKQMFSIWGDSHSTSSVNTRVLLWDSVTTWVILHLQSFFSVWKLGNLLPFLFYFSFHSFLLAFLCEVIWTSVIFLSLLFYFLWKQNPPVA